ncbi:hypothetical protein L226DRAFT_467722 [Lentinus tigrinus ALCF2SS1-7]|uniref:Fungal-type protein kinase domain-containing protein n=1 Tax=Lentinus tigrinus ALCF2SS1-6 TaxID=1328759 RepID=A0A5C2S4J3_9APHY|nr:hypothetical protein L227DRAFT_631681 [Lentinus tigrinus ALCF2SS1-6]RPD71827.1 hypothetical protein L226DRAFT_467722 [Lentinus tigrinus ALCF2SS1-7]
MCDEERQIDALNEADVCGGYRFLTTLDSLSGEDATHHGLYPLSVVPEIGNNHSDWLFTELSLVYRAANKHGDYDPFHDTHVCSPAMNKYRKRVLEEMLSHVKRVLCVQQRYVFFFLLILGDDARFVRFDTAGITTTKRFNYKARPAILLSLLSRFCRASPQERGHDPTARLVPPESEIGKMMRGRLESPIPDEDIALRYFRESLDVKWPWWCLEVHDEVSGEIKSFAVGRPHYCSVDAFAHATRGYVALDLTTGQLTFLKDSWRPTYGSCAIKEGSVLKKLNAHNVPFVPTVLCHGDLPGQVSTSQDVAATSEVSYLGGHTGYIHYRLSMKEVGKPVEDFENGAQLISVIRDCVKAHKHAYEAGVLHRDISPKNFLLHRGEDGHWVGLLIDWDVSTAAVKDPNHLAFPERGTWEFMSVRAQFTPPSPVGIPDELESFLYSLVYVAIQYITSSVSPENIPYFIRAAFHDYQICPTTGMHRPCLMKWYTMDSGKFSVYAWTRFRDDMGRLLFLSGSESGWTLHPIDCIITSLMSWLTAYHNDPPKPETGSENVEKYEKLVSKVKSHDALLEVMEEALEVFEWPADDKEDLSAHWKHGSY